METKVEGTTVAQDNTAATQVAETAKGTVLTDGVKADPATQTQGETKTVDDAAKAKAEADAKAASDAKAKTEGAPEKYEFKAPEGVTLAPEAMGKFETLAKELNLPQEKAQKLVDLAAEHSKGLIEAQVKQWATIREGWINELKNDKEFGGDKFQETTERAKRTLRTFGNDKVFEFLEQTGYGDNAELIRMFAKIDKQIGEDKIVDGKSAGTQRSPAEILFGKN